jgi:hypothetical protein
MLHSSYHSLKSNHNNFQTATLLRLSEEGLVFLLGLDEGLLEQVGV